MSAQPTQTPVRRDVEPLHHVRSPFVTDAWQALQQIHHFHVSKDVVRGRKVKGISESHR
jgi:hypothetical protein